jgi:hypothetical protein
MGRRPNRVDGGFKGNRGGGERGGGEGSEFVPEFVMAEVDEATTVTCQCMLDSERGTAAVAGGW